MYIGLSGVLSVALSFSEFLGSNSSEDGNSEHVGGGYE